MGKNKDTLAVIRALGAEIRRAQWLAKVYKRNYERAQDQLEQTHDDLRDIEGSLAAMDHCPKCGSRMVRWELAMSDLGPDREAVLSCGACDCVWQRTGFADFWSGIKDVLEIAGEDADEMSTEEEEGA